MARASITSFRVTSSSERNLEKTLEDVWLFWIGWISWSTIVHLWQIQIKTTNWYRLSSSSKKLKHQPLLFYDCSWSSLLHQFWRKDWLVDGGHSLNSSKVIPEENANMNTNELQCLDNIFFRYSTSYKVESIQHIQKKLVELEMTIDDFNFYVESMSRHLISTRTSILNFVSFY